MNDSNLSKKHFLPKFFYLSLFCLLALFLLIGGWLYLEDQRSLWVRQMPLSRSTSNRVIAGEMKDNQFMITLPTIKTNILLSNDLSTISLSATLELYKPADKKEVLELLPKVQDLFIAYLQQIDIRESQNSLSVFRLKEAMLHRLNILLAPIQIKDILFKDLLIERGTQLK